MVTVVDAINFLKDFREAELLQDKGKHLGEEDMRSVADLLIEQVEFCDVILVSKTDLCKKEDLEELTSILRSLNTQADIIPLEHGKVSLDKVLATHKFDFEKASQAPGWLKEARGEHVPETEEYGITSYVYRERLPFDPQKIHDVLKDDLPGVIRAKGHFWIATRPDWVAEFSLAGSLSSVAPLGTWWASVPEERRPTHPQAQEYMAAHWAEPFGDRRQELVFIGSGIAWPALKAKLDNCLLPAASVAALAAVEEMPDPFPGWRRA